MHTCSQCACVKAATRLGTDELVLLQGLPETYGAIAVPGASNVHAQLLWIKVQHSGVQPHLVQPDGVRRAGRVHGA